MFTVAVGDDDHDNHVRRSVGYAYAAMLLVLVTRYSERVEWLEKFGHRLLAFAEKGWHSASVSLEAKGDGSRGDNWTTGAISRAKLQSNHHHQQTNIQFFTGRMSFLSPNQQ